MLQADVHTLTCGYTHLLAYLLACGYTHLLAGLHMIMHPPVGRAGTGRTNPREVAECWPVTLSVTCCHSPPTSSPSSSPFTLLHHYPPLAPPPTANHHPWEGSTTPTSVSAAPSFNAIPADFPQRKISGTKLGSAVKKDILKHSLAASKSRSAKDPHLEVNLLGKALADDGLAIACDGLRQALSQGSVRLDELNLAENKLTLNGLRILTPIVRLASKDLKDLDLRANEFVIVTQEDADNWEGFLESFGDVSGLPYSSRSS